MTYDSTLGNFLQFPSVRVSVHFPTAQCDSLLTGTRHGTPLARIWHAFGTHLAHLLASLLVHLHAISF